MTFSAKAFATEALVLFVGAVCVSRPLLVNPDIQIHDTYFVLRPAIVCLGMALLLSLFAAVYSIVSLKFRFAQWHFWWTTASVSGFWCSFILLGQFSEQGAAGFHETNAVFAMALFVLSTLAFLVSPLMFVFNLGLSFSQHRRGAL